MEALVILSGGQDSVTCLYAALAQYGDSNVTAITFDYGQNHSIEIECASQVCHFEDVKHVIINVDFLDRLVKSALTSGGDVNVLNEKGLPASFVPNRNALFITLAHAFAQKIGAGVLITGVCQTDYSGYPDCRRVFVDALEYALNIGSESNIKILTPLMHLTKAQTFEMAANLGKLEQVKVYSHTCYNGDHSTWNEWGYGCGKCPACDLRAKGYSQYVDGLLVD